MTGDINKAKPDFYDEVISFLIKMLETYENEVNKGSNPNYLIKEAALYMLQNTAPFMLSYAADKEIELLFKKFLVHEFSVSLRSKYS